MTYKLTVLYKVIKKLSIIDINEHLIEMYDLRYFMQQFGPEFIFLSSLHLFSIGSR